MSDNVKESNLIPLTGMFHNTSKSGMKYFQGKTKEDVRYVMFKNNKKEAGDNKPEWILYIDKESMGTTSNPTDTVKPYNEQKKSANPYDVDESWD